jgi:hypothetical protein
MVDGIVQFFGNAGDQIQLANNALASVSLVASIAVGNHVSTQTGGNVLTISSSPITVLAGSSIYVGVGSTTSSGINNSVATDNQGHGFTGISLIGTGDPQ